jgi:hypothetical protein
LRQAELPADGDPLERARQALRAANELRGERLPEEEVLLEVADPWNRPSAVYSETATKVARLCEDLVPALFGDRAAAQTT